MVEIHGVLPGRWLPSRKGIVPNPLMLGTIPSGAGSRFVLLVGTKG
jgi:hypothetical protein